MRWCVSSLPKLQRHSVAFLAHGLVEASKFGSGRRELDGVRARRRERLPRTKVPRVTGEQTDVVGLLPKYGIRYLSRCLSCPSRYTVQTTAQDRERAPHHRR